MEKKREDLGEAALYFIDQESIDRVSRFFPESIAEEIKEGEAFGLAIAEEDEIKGAVAAHFEEEENVLEIRSLFVAEEARRRALATTMVVQMMEAVLEETRGELRYVTVSFLEESSGCRELFEKIGFFMEEAEEAESFFLSREELTDSMLNTEGKEGTAGKFFSELSEFEKKELLRNLEEEGADYITLKDLKEIRGEISPVIYGEEKLVQACCLFSGKEHLVLRQFYAGKGQSRLAIKVLKTAVHSLLKDSDWTQLEVPCVTASSARLLKKLLGVKEGRKYLRGVFKA